MFDRKRSLSLLLALALCLSLLPVWARAAEQTAYYDPTDGEKTADAVVLAAGTSAWKENWYVVKGEIAVSSRVTVSGDVNLILADDAILTAAKGITVTGSNSLTIWGQTGQSGVLTATGSQTDAAIGGAEGKDGCNITINGGTVNASAATASIGNAAGIGGGEDGSGHDITVNGGTVNAYGTNTSSAGYISYGAGIGGGNGGEGYDITINGGTVNARCAANEYGNGAGIGGGNRGEGYRITIRGGTVYALGGNSGAGIGGGSSADGHDITISDGDVTAKCRETVTSTSAKGEAAGIGGGMRKDGYNITVTGGTVHAYGGTDGGSGIGGSYGGGAHDIRIENGDVTAVARKGNNAGIGGGSSMNVSDITISGGTVTATGFGSGAGIGSGGSSTNAGLVENITISGGTITATGGDQGGAGIGTGGGGQCGDMTNLTISGGTVYATGGRYGTGIGGGGNTSYGKPSYGGGAVTGMTVSGDQTVVVAVGGAGAPGIGSGRGTPERTNPSKITLQGGSITATAGDAATEAIRAELTFDNFSHQTYGNTEENTECETVVESSDNLQDDWSIWHWVRIEPSETQPKALTVSPAKASVALNGVDTGEARFTASLGEDDVTQETEWSVAGAESPQTAIERGVLTVGADERAAVLTVTGKHSGQEQTAEVTVTQPTLTVTFQNETTTYRTQSVTRYQPASDPGAPTREGYTFAGWFAEGSEEAWHFDEPVTQSMTLTARWTPIPVSGVRVSVPSLTLTEGESGELTATVSPETALHRTVEWSAVPEDAVSLLKDGNTVTITARKGGVVTVTASVDGQSADCVVTVKHKWNAPTFTWFQQDGWSAEAKFTCDCGHEQTVSATVQSRVTIPATCTANGTTTYTATAEFEDQSFTEEKTEQDVEALGHDFQNYVPDGNATCTEDGTETGKCTRCGEPDTRADVGSATGHRYGQPEFVWSKGETWTAEAKFTCLNDCGNTETVPAAVESSVTTEPTCTEMGITTYTATAEFGDRNYTDEKTERDVEALGHDFQNYVPDGNATCTEDGTETGKCTRCGVPDTRADVGSATGHRYGQPEFVWSKGGTWTAEAKFTCLNDCGSTETVSAAVESSVTTEPTCTEMGTTTYTATVHSAFDQKDYTERKEVRDVPAKGHTENAPIREKEIAATCTEEGSYDEVVYCAVCGTELDRATKRVAATGHAWDSGVVTREPSELREGERTYACTRCGETYTQTLAKLTCDYSDNCPSHGMTDVPRNWAHAGIDYAVRNGLMNGMGGDRFEPETPMTRGMLVTVLWRYAGSPKEGQNTFRDVSDGRYYTDAVAWAAANGIVNGVGENRFDPEGNVTREQMVTILYRYTQTHHAGSELTAFADAADVSTYATDAVRWAVAEGILNGSNGMLLPKHNATRAEVAAMLMRFIENVLK